MSSLKMTFSLASLVLILGLIAMPVMAQEDLPVPLTGVTIALPALVTAAAAGDVDERFTVIGAADVVDDVQTVIIPDLEERFLTGTTIALLAPVGIDRDGDSPEADAKTDIRKGDVVISEIMWGLDEDVFGERTNRQWIEFYNTTTTSATNPASAEVDMEDWFLYFVDTHDTIMTPEKVDDVENVVKLNLIDLPNDDADDADEQYILVDMVSNLAGGGWTVVTDAGTYGQSGLIPTADTSTAVPINLVSMYRNINYDNVTKDHKKAKQPDDRNAQLGAIPGGGGSGSWKRSKRAFAQNLVGSPGERHFKGTVTLLSASSVDRSKVIVNEIGNSKDDGQDWVEFRNVSGDAYNLKNHHLSYVKKAADPAGKAVDQETSMVNFKDIDAWIPKDGVLLVLASDPDDDSHPIAGGINIKDSGITWDGAAKAYDIEDNTDRIPNGSQSLYYVDDGFDVHKADETLIILRSAHDKLGTDANLLDVNGGLSIEYRAATHATNLWPLKKTGAAHKNTIDGSGRKFPEGAVYQKNNAGGGTGEKHWAKRGYTGIGYKREFDSGDAYGGTPGYGNGAVKVFDKKVDHADYKAPPVTISEIMYASGNGLPQWIELQQ